MQISWTDSSGNAFRNSLQSMMLWSSFTLLGLVKSAALFCFQLLSLRILFSDHNAWLLWDLLWIAMVLCLCVLV